MRRSAAFFGLPVVLVAIALASACADPGAAGGDDDATETDENAWDSADGNPTHPTHSIMAEFAIDRLKARYPELATHHDSIVRGANAELHDLVLKKSPVLESLRLEIGGNNWAAEHPEILWERARTAYRAGHVDAAYFHVGIILHYVQDMGVPAHAFHVIHQSGPRSWDHTELLAFFDFHGDLRAPGPQDPKLADPIAYIEWSAQSSRDHFHAMFPGATYHRKFLPQAYDDLTDEHWAFLRGREAHCAHATAFALESAASAFAALR